MIANKNNTAAAHDAKLIEDFDKVKPPKVDLWVRQEGEPVKAYHAFKVYRDLGAMRSQRQVAEKMGIPESSLGMVAGWSSKHKWVMRSDAYDVEQERLHSIEMRIARRTMARRQSKMAQRFITMGMKAMELKYGDIFDEKNEKLEKAVLAGEVTLDDIRKICLDFSKLERTILGQPSDITEQQHTGGLIDDQDRKPAIPITHEGRVIQTLGLLERARERTGLPADSESN